jgi:hypothetical protein
MARFAGMARVSGEEALTQYKMLHSILSQTALALKCAPSRRHVLEVVELDSSEERQADGKTVPTADFFEQVITSKNKFL